MHYTDLRVNYSVASYETENQLFRIVFPILFVMKTTPKSSFPIQLCQLEVNLSLKRAYNINDLAI